MIDAAIITDKAKRVAEADWRTLPPSRRRQLTTEAQARDHARHHTNVHLGLWEAWLTTPLTQEEREAFRSQFEAAFIAAWKADSWLGK